MTTEIGRKFVTLGRISGLYGVKGWVKVYSHTSPLGNILKYPKWYLKVADGWQEFQLETGKPHGKGIIAKLATIYDRDIAATLIDTDIAIPRDQLPELGNNEFYWTDLEGIKVITIEGVELGKLDYLFETGANDVIVVMGERQRLLPYIDQVVKRVDLDAGIMEVDWDPEF